MGTGGDAERLRPLRAHAKRTRIAAVGSGCALVAVALASALGAFSCDSGSRVGEGFPHATREDRVPEPLGAGGRARVVGYVRDVNGNPLPGARVSVAGTGVGTRAGRLGRYELRVPSGARTLVATHPAHADQLVRVRQRGRRGARLDFALAVTRPGQAAGPNSADVLIFWTRCGALVEISTAELERLMGLGVDGFVCSVGRLRSMGGEYEFTGDTDSRLAGASYRLQRELRASPLVQQARRGRLRLYLGFHASDYNNLSTPFKDWFDDRAWSRDVLTPIRDLASAARSLGFVGLAVDQELYPPSGREPTATWAWDYPGSDRSEAEVRGQVARRGRQLMRAMLAGYPGLELVAYDMALPGDWGEKVQEVVNDDPDAFARDVRIDLWNGLSSVQGYAAIRWPDATFYKSPHLGGKDWSDALAYNANATYSLLSQRFTNWAYASSRLHVTPFSWIDEGPTDFSSARDPAYVEEQLAAFRTWGTGGWFANYAYRAPMRFDYEPYASAIRSASTPATVDEDPPELTITSPTGGQAVGDRVDIDGTARDEFGIRVVRWYDRRGRFGTAELLWDGEQALTAEGPWLMRWRIAGVPLSPGTNEITIVVEDIKGLARLRTLTVRR